MDRREINQKTIISKVEGLVLKCNTDLPKDVLSSIKACSSKTKGAQEKRLLQAIIKNQEIARTKKLPLCQDTGISIFFIEMGNVNIAGNRTINELVDDGVAKAYGSKKLRPSILSDAFNGKNTKNNTPAVIHIEHTKTKNIKISYLAKGGGSENASAVTQLSPSDGIDGVKRFVLKLVKEKGPNACPPLIIGIGVGGTIEQAVVASKKALFRKIGSRNKNKFYAKIEKDLKDEINSLGIGVMGLGGNCTTLDVFIASLPRHIATLCVAVSILCHSARRGEVTI